MNMFARFDENPAMTLQDIKETKRYGRTDALTDNVKTVYPTTNKVCGGYKHALYMVRKHTNITKQIYFVHNANKAII